MSVTCTGRGTGERENNFDSFHSVGVLEPMPHGAGGGGLNKPVNMKYVEASRTNAKEKKAVGENQQRTAEEISLVCLPCKANKTKALKLGRELLKEVQYIYGCNRCVLYSRLPS